MFNTLCRRVLGSVVATAAAVLPVVAVSSPAAGDTTSGTLFAITGPNQSVLSRVDPTLGTVSPIEDLAGANQGQLGTMTGNAATHRIYAVRTSVVFTPPSQIDITNVLLTINTMTGSVFVSPPINVPVGEIGYDPATNTIYLLGTTGLFKVDPVSGATTVVATAAKIGISCCGVESMAVVPGGHTIYINDDAQDFTTGVNTDQIVTLDTSSGAVTSSPVVPGSVRIIAFDAGNGKLLGLTDCCPHALVQLDPGTAAESSIAQFGTDPNQIMTFAMAVDPNTHTVFTDLQSFDPFDFTKTQDEIVSIGDQSANVSSSNPIADDLVWSQYFEVAAPVVTPATVSAAIRADLNSGAIANTGVANSLLAELANAGAAGDRHQCGTATNVYQAFINELNAQNGKAVVASTATQLIAEADVLIASCP